MRKTNIFRKTFLLMPIMAVAVLFQNCTEKIDDSARYVFEGNTILSYLESQVKEGENGEKDSIYKEYIDLLNKVTISEQSASTVAQLMSARGNYTCFAPTNDAIEAYLEDLVEQKKISIPSWDAPEFIADPKLLKEKQEQVVLNSIIDGGDDNTPYQVSYFSERAERAELIGLPNMLDNKLQVFLTENYTWPEGVDPSAMKELGKYTVEGAVVDGKNNDIYTINGRVHQVHQVIAPSTESLGQYFEKVLEEFEKGYYVYAALTEACGLLDELKKTEDTYYFTQVQTGAIKDLPNHNTEAKPGYLPNRRYIGFTLFAEPDEWWENELGIQINENITQEEIVNAVYSYVENNGYYKRNGATYGKGLEELKQNSNILNQFVTYHMLPARIANDKLVIHYNELWYNPTDKVKQASVMDYYTTMGMRRLLKTYEASRTYGDRRQNVVWLNRIPTLDNGRHGKYTENGVPVYPGIEIKTTDIKKVYNAYIYPIADCLYFNDETAGYLASERMRIDVTTFFKELMTNDMRCNENDDDRNLRKGFPTTKDFSPKETGENGWSSYFDDCEIGENSRFYYLTGRMSKTYCWHNYQGDELNVIGQYKLTMKLPPVPKDGMYEIRFGVSTSAQRGMCQVYFGTNKNALPAAGIPLDLRKGMEYWYIPGTPLTNYGYAIDDINDDEANIEVDKKLRNNDLMKAPNSYYRIGQSITMRAESSSSYSIARRIIIRQNLEANQTYYIQFKNVLEDEGAQFFMDYIEFCPKEIYDNPTQPEDIW